MNERLRLDYLGAMGITQYAARFPLPGALPSVVDGIADDDDDVNTTDAIVAEQQGTKTLPDNRPHIATLLAEENTKPLSHSKATITGTVTRPTTPETTSTAATLFRCQLAFWIVDDLLVLADAPRLDNAQLVLLRNILKAIGRTEYLPDVRQFSWPLPQRKEKSLHAAREHFQGMLDGGPLQGNGVRQILCFGNDASVLLASTGNTADSVQQYRDWPVISVFALHEMIAQPARKADVWRTLQMLVRT